MVKVTGTYNTMSVVNLGPTGLPIFHVSTVLGENCPNNTNNTLAPFKVWIHG